MRVGLVVYGSLATTTGGYQYDRQLVAHLEASGDTVDVVALPQRTYAGRLADNLRPSLLDRLSEFDVLLEDELCHPSLVAVNRRLRRRARPAVVAVVHCLRSCERPGSVLHVVGAAVERRYLATVDGAVFNSEATRADTERLLGRALPGVLARPSGDHLPRSPGMTSAAPVAAPLRLLSIANVVPNKGLHVLVEALARLPQGSCRLTVLGSLTMDESYVRRVRNQIRRAGLEADVEFLGAVPNADVAGHLASHHVVVGPSFYEAAGIAYLEAMRFGVPVIATAAGGAAEVIADGREGFLVAPGDAVALAERLQRLRSDPALLYRLGRGAHQRSKGHPTWAQSFEPVRPFLLSLVAGQHRVRA